MNPNIVYLRGSDFGQRGPDADQRRYDSAALWTHIYEVLREAGFTDDNRSNSRSTGR